MKQNQNLLGYSQTYWIGIIFILISLLLYGLTLFFKPEPFFESAALLFPFNFMLVIIYFFIILVDNKRTKGKRLRFYNLSHNILLAVLANISAYALNQQIPVFQESTFWLSFFLVTSNLALLWVSYKKFENPDWLNFLLVLVIGMNLVFQVYETIYIAPIMALGVLVVWFFGLSLHAFVPLWLCILFFKLSLKAVNEKAELVRPLIVGVSIPVTMLVFFLIRWVGVSNQIHEQWQDAKCPKLKSNCLLG